ncbi:MAG TPA: inositol monophosphatase family protein [Gaiellales bacterium]|nr:inositol monophosphatase family protein [Gaiellales bacterium]
MRPIDHDDGTLLAVAEEAARSAGRLLLDRFGRPPTGVDRKSSATDMVSDADRESEQLIRELLRRERPGDAVLGEERGATLGGGGLLWVVDPLDGTTNYLYRHPTWSVSIACEDDDGARVAVVHQPATGETFTAVRGGGARLGAEPVAVSDASELARSLIGTGFGYRAEVRVEQARALVEILPAVRDMRRRGSAALDLCWVACGRLDGYYELGVQRWDTAAGVLIAREAGAVITPLEPVGAAEGGVLAAAPGIHDALNGLVGAALLH